VHVSNRLSFRLFIVAVPSLLATVQNVLSHTRPRAFSLIEATVVMIIIGILSALAITSYQWATGSAHDSDSQQALQAIALSSSGYYSEHSAWPSLSDMPNVESAYSYVGPTTASDNSEQVSVGYDTTNSLLDLSAYDTSTSTCFFLAVLPPGGSGTPLQISSTSLPCSASTITSESLTSASGSPW
jgi:prepilin-type N-terminal cleavage/methylation domain-containing protein